MLFIVQNDPEVPAGTYAEFLEEMGVTFRILKPFDGEELPPFSGVSAVIVLGGAMGVHDTEKHPFLVDVKRFITGCVDRAVPYLGICLGGQLLASVLGAGVISGSPYGEKGTLSVQLTGEGKEDPLFEDIPEEFVTFQWHNDSFEIPPGGIRLASSPVCPNQAFRYGQNAWGTQFHPEVNSAIVDCWARWTEETAPFVDSFLAAFMQNEEIYRDAARRLLVNFFRAAGIA